MTGGRRQERRPHPALVQRSLDVALEEETERMIGAGIDEHQVLERVEQPADRGRGTVTDGLGRVHVRRRYPPANAGANLRENAENAGFATVGET